jgi:pseudoazurin
MKERIMRALLFAAIPMAFTIGAYGAEHQVLMLNKDSEGRPMQFEPAFLKVEPGDTVTFIPQDKGHNSESLPDLIPEGAQLWKGKINEQVTIKLTTEGFYAYRCLPHFGLGMVGLIQVGGNANNREAIENANWPGLAKQRIEELLGEFDTGLVQ